MAEAGRLDAVGGFPIVIGSRPAAGRRESV